MSLSLRFIHVAGFSALLALGVSGCSDADGRSSSDAPAQTFIGELQGTDALIAIVEQDRSWIAYVCGGPQTYATLTRWFGGTGQGGAGERTLRADAEDASLVAKPAADAREGTITNGDREFAFRADPIPTRVVEVTGLYSAIHTGCRAGLVVMPGSAGSTPRMQGVWCDRTGQVGQVTPIMPLTVQDAQVAVRAGEPAQQLYMQPAVPPLELTPGSAP